MHEIGLEICHDESTLGSQPTTRASLLLRLRDRDNHDAWSEFLAIYEPVIYRLAQRRCSQDADAREVVQEVLLRVASAIERFDPQGNGTFRGWLSQTTRRVTVDRFRKLSVRIEPAIGGGKEDELPRVANGSATGDGIEEEFDQAHRRQLFHAAADQIRPTVHPSTWQAFWETTVEGRSAEDVSRELGLTQGAVYVARCRVLKKIREFVHQQESQ